MTEAGAGDLVCGPPEAADVALLRGLREGEERCFEQLWSRFGARLHGYAASCRGGDEDLAEDIVVQSLAAAVRSIASFDPRRSAFPAWVYGVARRVIQAELRKQRRRTSVPASAQVPLDTAAPTTPEEPQRDLAARIDAARKVRLLSAALSGAEMEVLVLHFVDEFSVREIAGITGRSWRAVDSLLYRAKEKARERLAEDGD